MFIMEAFAGFDALALGVIIGSAGLLAGLVWVLIDNRQFEGFKPAANRFQTRTAAAGTHPVTEHKSAREPQSPRAA